MTQWGGARKGAGRKKGSLNRLATEKVVALSRGGARPGSGPKAKYGEPTKPMRIPARMERSILHYIEHQGFNLPVYSMRVPMGLTSPTVAEVDRTLNLNDLVKHPGATFFHPVEGDSMEPTVLPGDLAMIDSKLEPMHNDVVLASIDGGLTLKRLQMKGGKTWLEADNPIYQPILLNPDAENSICGVMLIAIRPVSLNHIKPF